MNWCWCACKPQRAQSSNNNTKTLEISFFSATLSRILFQHRFLILLFYSLPFSLIFIVIKRRKKTRGKKSNSQVNHTSQISIFTHHLQGKFWEQQQRSTPYQREDATRANQRHMFIIHFDLVPLSVSLSILFLSMLGCRYCRVLQFLPSITTTLQFCFSFAILLFNSIVSAAFRTKSTITNIIITTVSQEKEGERESQPINQSG